MRCVTPVVVNTKVDSQLTNGDGRRSNYDSICVARRSVAKFYKSRVRGKISERSTIVLGDIRIPF